MYVTEGVKKMIVYGFIKQQKMGIASFKLLDINRIMPFIMISAVVSR